MLVQKRVLDTRGMVREADVKYVVSYGGGVDSTAMIFYLVNHDIPLDYVVFADTGTEIPETLEYLDIMARYCKTHDIKFVIVETRSKRSLIDRCRTRKVIPSQVWRWCTRDLKVAPIHAFYKTLHSHIYQYMGIDFDEPGRMKPEKVDWITNLYPLVDNKIKRADCADIIRNEGFPVPEKSGCSICPFNTLERWEWIWNTHPDLYNEAMKLEEDGKHFGKQHLAPEGYTLRKLRDIFVAGGELPVIENDENAVRPCGGQCAT